MKIIDEAARLVAAARFKKLRLGFMMQLFDLFTRYFSL